MNKVILMGRLTKDPEVRYSQNENGTAIGNYTLAVDRRGKKVEGQPTADFIPCVTFGKAAEFAQKYLKKGTKIAITGRIQTRNYTNKEGNKVYVTEVIVEEQEFAESKSASQGQGSAPAAQEAAPVEDGFSVDIPEGIEDELPFT